jgi:hypothetical protein
VEKGSTFACRLKLLISAAVVDWQKWQRKGRFDLGNLDAVERRSYAGIDQVEPLFGQSQILRIELDGVNFELFTSLKRDSDQMLVFGQGAIDRTKHELPVFQRWSWAERHPCSVIVLNDPTLYLGEIPLGWFQGTAERHYLPQCVAIVRHLVERMDLRPTDVLFYGTSGGGFTSLMMTAMLGMYAYHMELHFIPFITAVNEMILERDSLRSTRVFTELYAADREHTAQLASAPRPAVGRMPRASPRGFWYDAGRDECD